MIRSRERRKIRRLLSSPRAARLVPFRIRLFRDGQCFLSDRRGVTVFARSAREALQIARDQ